jgi:hypothetical protein
LVSVLGLAEKQAEIEIAKQQAKEAAARKDEYYKFLMDEQKAALETEVLKMKESRDILDKRMTELEDLRKREEELFNTRQVTTQRLEQQTKRNSEDRTAKRILAPYLVQLQSA